MPDAVQGAKTRTSVEPRDGAGVSRHGGVGRDQAHWLGARLREQEAVEGPTLLSE